MAGPLAEALEHLVAGIVDNPRTSPSVSGPAEPWNPAEGHGEPDDLGRVIGRGGRTAKSLRTVIGAISGNGGVRIDFVDVNGR